jgi:MoaA/NifB/PqqE/SkfB family radical SAM enzyme
VLSEKAFGRLLDGLAEIAYSGRVLWHLYNEPLAAPDILLPRMARARKLLPGARFILNSNGDYLDRGTLDALEENGLNALTVSIYGPDHGRWDDAYVRERVLAVGEMLGLDGKLVEAPGMSFSMTGRVRGLSINVAGRNLWKTGYDRGGLVPALAAPRSSPCLAPFAEFLVDHRGYVLPCCNVYTDRPEHIPHTIGNLDEADIFELYSNVRAQAWRRGVLVFDPGGSLCEGCSRGDVPEIATGENRQRLGDFVKEMTA